MRATLLAAASLALLGGLLAFLNAGGPELPVGEGPARPATPAAADPAPEGPSDGASTDPRPLEGPERLAARAGDRTDRTGDPLAGPTRPFRGIVMSRAEGERPVQARFGRLDLELLIGGTRTPLTLDLAGGRFDARVPTRARLVLLGGDFEGTRVRFEAPKGPFDPSPEEYALVAIPIPEIRLDVVEGSQDVPLTGISVAHANDPTGSWLGDEAPAFDLLIEGAESPLTLPDLGARRPIWLRVRAEGYAATHVMVDPRKPGRKTVRLHPAGELDLRVSGRRVSDLRAIVMGRDEPDGRRPHVATFSLTRPEIQRDQDGVLFPIRGLAARPHHVIAKGVDRRGRLVDLGELDVVLEPGLRRTATLRVD